MIKWKRPSGTIIETNDDPATIAKCESMGWTQVKAAKAAPKKAPAPAPKAKAKAPVKKKAAKKKSTKRTRR